MKGLLRRLSLTIRFKGSFGYGVTGGVSPNILHLDRSNYMYRFLWIDFICRGVLHVAFHISAL